MLITLTWCCLIPAAFAADGAPRSATAKDAIALAEKGAQFIRQYGKDPIFNHGALYLAMRDLKGITLAHPTTSLIGKNLLDVPDADGKLFRHDMVAIANGAGRGWVDYKFRNPATGKVEAKTTYVLRSGDVALEAGIYKPEAEGTGLQASLQSSAFHHP
jgi:signal transduction histidine kinase